METHACLAERVKTIQLYSGFPLVGASTILFSGMVSGLVVLVAPQYPRVTPVVNGCPQPGQLRFFSHPG